MAAGLYSTAQWFSECLLSQDQHKTLPGNLLKMQILRLYPRPMEPETPVMGTRNLCFNKLSWWFRCLLHVRSTGTVGKSTHSSIRKSSLESWKFCHFSPVLSWTNYLTFLFFSSKSMAIYLIDGNSTFLKSFLMRIN